MGRLLRSNAPLQGRREWKQNAAGLRCTRTGTELINAFGHYRDGKLQAFLSIPRLTPGRQPHPFRAATRKYVTTGLEWVCQRGNRFPATSTRIPSTFVSARAHQQTTGAIPQCVPTLSQTSISGPEIQAPGSRSTAAQCSSATPLVTWGSLQTVNYKYMKPGTIGTKAAILSPFDMRGISALNNGKASMSSGKVHYPALSQYKRQRFAFVAGGWHRVPGNISPVLHFPHRWW